MLTFFEYLRQRAFESVLTGAQEALDFLERQQALAEPKKKLSKSAETDSDDSPKPPRKRDETLVPPHSKSANRKADDDPLLKNSKAGRPSNDQKDRK